MSCQVDWRNPFRKPGTGKDFAMAFFPLSGPAVALYGVNPWLWLAYMMGVVLLLWFGLCTRNNVRWSHPWALVVGTEFETGPLGSHWAMDSADERNWELIQQFPAWRYTITGMCRVMFLCRSDAALFRLQAQGPVRLLDAATPPV